MMVVIAGRKYKEKLLEDLRELDSRVVNIIYGKSSVNGGYIQEILGFIPEEQKVVITCLLPAANVDKLLSLLTEKYEFGKPDTGIAFSLPISGLAV